MRRLREDERVAIREAIKTHRAKFYVYIVLRALIVLALILQVFLKNWESVMLYAAALALFTLPAVVERKVDLAIPDVLEIIIYLFIVAAVVLGEINSFYQKIPGWDTMLHSINGFLCAAVGLSLINLINRRDNLAIHLSPFYVALFSFCFSMTIGVLWEFYEFSIDFLFRTDMQKDYIIHRISTIALDTTLSNKPVLIDDIHSVVIDGVPLGVDGYIDIGLIDTMKDLFVNFIGAMAFSIFGYFYAKYEKKQGLVHDLLVTSTSPKTMHIDAVSEHPVEPGKDFPGNGKDDRSP